MNDVLLNVTATSPDNSTASPEAYVNVIVTFLDVSFNKSPVVEAVNGLPSYVNAILNFAHKLVASVAVDPFVAAGAHESYPKVTPVKVASISPSFATFQV